MRAVHEWGSIMRYVLQALRAGCACRAAGSEAVENWSKEFPNSSDGDDASPIVLWPFKLSELGPIGYIKLPALPLEPIFGEVWRYDFRKEIARLGLSLPPFLAPAPAPK